MKMHEKTNVWLEIPYEGRLLKLTNFVILGDSVDGESTLKGLFSMTSCVDVEDVALARLFLDIKQSEGEPVTFHFDTDGVWGGKVTLTSYVITGFLEEENGLLHDIAMINVEPGRLESYNHILELKLRELGEYLFEL